MFAEPDLLVSRLLFVGLVVEAIEALRLRRAYADGGLFSRAMLGIVVGGVRPELRLGATHGGTRAVTVAALTQAAAAGVVVGVGTGAPLGIAAAVVCLVANGYLRTRRQIGGSGAEQLTFIVLVTFGLVVLAGAGEEARRLGDGFVAAQLALAYAASGVAKAFSTAWRRGEAMTGIFATEAYGTPRQAAVLADRPWLDRLLCWATIGWELAFPLALFAPVPVTVAILAAGVLFHAACALLMGLNRFFWAFCGCYPAVWATSMLLR